MKKPALIIFLLTGIFFQACIRQQNIGQLLRKPASRRAIITDIISDRALMAEVLDSMIRYDKAMVVYKYHKTIIGKAASDNMRGKMNDTMTGKDITQTTINQVDRQFSMGNAYRKLRTQLGKNSAWANARSTNYPAAKK